MNITINSDSNTLDLPEIPTEPMRVQLPWQIVGMVADQVGRGLRMVEYLRRQNKEIHIGGVRYTCHNDGHEITLTITTGHSKAQTSKTQKGRAQEEIAVLTRRIKGLREKMGNVAANSFDMIEGLKNEIDTAEALIQDKRDIIADCDKHIGAAESRVIVFPANLRGVVFEVSA